MVEDNEAVELEKEAARLRALILEDIQRCSDSTLERVTAGLPPVPHNKMRVRHTLKGPLKKVTAIHWANDSKHVLSASQDRRLIVWDAQTTNKRHAIVLPTENLLTCAFSPSGRLVAGGGLTNYCYIYSLETTTGVFKTELNGHEGFLSCCRFLEEHQLMTCGGEGCVSLIDIETKKIITSFLGHTSSVMTLAVAYDKRTFLTGGCDNEAKLWDFRDPHPQQTYKDNESDVNSVLWFPTQNAFATGSDDATCRLFDIRSYQQLGKYSHENVASSCNSVAFSSSGRLLFAGYDDFNINVWDSMTQKRAAILSGHTNRVASIGVAPSGSALCSGSWDTLLKIWN